MAVPESSHNRFCSEESPRNILSTITFLSLPNNPFQEKGYSRKSKTVWVNSRMSSAWGSNNKTSGSPILKTQWRSKSSSPKYEKVMPCPYTGMPQTIQVVLGTRIPFSSKWIHIEHCGWNLVETSPDGFPLPLHLSKNSLTKSSPFPEKGYCRKIKNVWVNSRMSSAWGSNNKTSGSPIWRETDDPRLPRKKMKKSYHGYTLECPKHFILRKSCRNTNSCKSHDTLAP